MSFSPLDTSIKRLIESAHPLSFVQKIFKEYEEPYRVIQVSKDTLECSIAQYKPPSISWADTEKPVNLSCSVPRVSLPLNCLTLRLRAAALSSVELSTNYQALWEEITSTLQHNLDQIPVHVVDLEESIVCVRETEIEDNRTSLETFISFGIGVGLSQRLHSRLCKENCTRCPKRLKCTLVPQECVLGWLIQGARV